MEVSSIKYVLCRPSLLYLLTSCFLHLPQYRERIQRTVRIPEGSKWWGLRSSWCLMLMNRGVMLMMPILMSWWYSWWFIWVVTCTRVMRMVHSMTRRKPHDKVLPKSFLVFASSFAFGAREILVKAHGKFTVTFA